MDKRAPTRSAHIGSGRTPRTLELRPLQRAVLLAGFLPLAALANLEAPDHVLYGNATVFGNPPGLGTVIEVRSVPAGTVLARYVLGRNLRLGGQFKLGIPMDTVEPRIAGRARPGDPVQLFVGGQLAGATSVGEEGVAVRLDIDPQLLGTGPALEIADVDMAEGQSGTAIAHFAVSLNTTSQAEVSVDWTTADGSATGGVACAAGIDYMTDAGTVRIAPDGLSGSIEVLVCGDTEIEPNETFTVELSAIANAVLADAQAQALLRDDDNVPTLAAADTRTLEPQGGSGQMLFRPRLSRAAANDVTVAYATQDGSAHAGLDYVASSGTATIAAGELETQVAVPLLPDLQVEPDETFVLLLSNPAGATLTRTEAIGTLVDPSYDPAVEDRGGPDSDSVPALLQPSGLAVSADGRHVYASSDTLDALLVFRRNEGDGALHYVSHYTNATAGFESALLDGADAVLLSPDGAHVYVAARGADAIVVFSRDATTGMLSLVGNSVQGSGGVDGLDGVVALAVSADGSHLYAAGRDAGAVVAFARDSSSGNLTFLEAERNGIDDASDDGAAVVALEQPNALLVSPDGAQVYVASRFGDALQVFTRDNAAGSPQFGRLAFRNALQDGLLGIDGLGGATDLVLSGDGRHLYVAAEDDDSVVLFDRGLDGGLVRRQQWTRGGSNLPGMDGASAIALSADGSELFVTGFADSSLTILRRATIDEAGLAAGALVPRQTLFDDQGSLTTMGGPSALVVSPDDRNVYVGAHTDNAIVVFLRQAFTGVFGDGFDD